MYALILSTNDSFDDGNHDNGEETIGFCPICLSPSAQHCGFDIIDYVEANINMRCSKCWDILLCPDPDSVDDIDSKPVTRCVIKITRIEAEEWAQENGFDVRSVPAKLNHAYLVGVVEVTGLRRDTEEPYTPVRTCSINSLEGIDTSHGGTDLFYRGICTSCDRTFESKIWGC